MFVNRNYVYWAKVTQQLTLSRWYSQLVVNHCCRLACSLLETPFVTRYFFFRKLCSWTDLFVVRGVREPRFHCNCKGTSVSLSQLYQKRYNTKPTCLFMKLCYSAAPSHRSLHCKYGVNNVAHSQIKVMVFCNLALHFMISYDDTVQFGRHVLTTLHCVNPEKYLVLPSPRGKYTKCNKFKWIYESNGARGGTVVEALCYKPEGHRIDSRSCHWNFSLT
jgi:hypothetical protein